MAIGEKTSIIATSLLLCSTSPLDVRRNDLRIRNRNKPKKATKQLGLELRLRLRHKKKKDRERERTKNTQGILGSREYGRGTDHGREYCAWHSRAVAQHAATLAGTGRARRSNPCLAICELPCPLHGPLPSGGCRFDL